MTTETLTTAAVREAATNGRFGARVDPEAFDAWLASVKADVLHAAAAAVEEDAELCGRTGARCHRVDAALIRRMAERGER